MSKRDSVWVGGILYDRMLEPPLRSIKKRIAEYILREDLFPVLDVCSGTGAQTGLIRKAAATRLGVYGVDLDRRMVGFAAARHPEVSFICGDARHMGFKNGVFKSAVISFALHDKPPELRKRIIAETRRLLCPDEGRIVLLDFEQPWSAGSRLGAVLTFAIERLAGGEHFRTGRAFIGSGGLRGFLAHQGLQEIERIDITTTCSAIVAAGFSSSI